MVHNNVSLFDLCILLCNIFFEWYCRRIAPELAHMAPFTVEWRTKAHQRIEAHWFIFDSHGLLIWNLECSSVCFYPVTASWYWKQDWDRLQGKNVAEVHEFMRASEVLENSSTKQKLKTTPKKHKQNRKKKTTQTIILPVDLLQFGLVFRSPMISKPLSLISWSIQRIPSPTGPATTSPARPTSPAETTREPRPVGASDDVKERPGPNRVNQENQESRPGGFYEKSLTGPLGVGV